MTAGVLIEQNGKRLQLRDANGDVHPVTEETAYRVLMTIVNDTRLPPIEQVNPAQYNVEETVRQAASAMLPEPLRPLAALGFQQATGKFRGGNRRIRREGRCRR